jgi:hypothetical protein
MNKGSEDQHRLTRRRVLQVLAAAGITGPAALDLLAQTRTKISADMLKQASPLIGGVQLSDERLKVAETALQRNLEQFQIVRDFVVPDSVEPAPIFIPARYKV